MFKRSGKQELSDHIDNEIKQARERLLDGGERLLKRKVRRIAAEGDRSQNALDLYTLAAGHRFNWTPEDWKAVLDKLDSSTLTLGEWLDNAQV